MSLCIQKAELIELVRGMHDTISNLRLNVAQGVPRKPRISMVAFKMQDRQTNDV